MDKSAKKRPEISTVEEEKKQVGLKKRIPANRQSSATPKMNASKVMSDERKANRSSQKPQKTAETGVNKTAISAKAKLKNL